jgi:chemotaxis signal transduction protein
MIEVVAMVELTPIQKRSPAYLGVANRHGNPMMVFDLRYVLNRQQKSIDVTSLILVTQLQNEFFGWVVDAVHQVEYFPIDTFQRLSTIEDNSIDQIVTEKSRIIQVVNNNLLLQQCRMQAREMA